MNYLSIPVPNRHRKSSSTFSLASSGYMDLTMSQKVLSVAWNEPRNQTNLFHSAFFQTSKSLKHGKYVMIRISTPICTIQLTIYSCWVLGMRCHELTPGPCCRGSLGHQTGMLSKPWWPVQELRLASWGWHGSDGMEAELFEMNLGYELQAGSIRIYHWVQECFIVIGGKFFSWPAESRRQRGMDSDGWCPNVVISTPTSGPQAFYSVQAICLK